MVRRVEHVKKKRELGERCGDGEAWGVSSKSSEDRGNLEKKKPTTNGRRQEEIDGRTASEIGQTRPRMETAETGRKNMAVIKGKRPPMKSSFNHENGKLREKTQRA